MKGKIYIVPETFSNRITNETKELLTVGKNLEKITGFHPVILLPGNNIEKTAHDLSRISGMEVTGLGNRNFEYYTPALLAEGIHDAITAEKFFICFPDTIRGSAAAAYLCGLMNAELITQVKKISKEEKNEVIHFHSTLAGDKFTIEKTPSGTRTIITVLSGAFQPYEKISEDTKSDVIKINPVSEDKYSTPILELETQEDSNLEDASAIISVGRGIGSEENIEFARDLSKIFSGSAIAGSRPVCDNGWLPLMRQVGITGKTVSPDLYIACGISGSRQHIAGMKNSGCIVSINNDSDADIFSISDYIVVEDLKIFIPALIKKYHEINKT